MPGRFTNFQTEKPPFIDICIARETSVLSGLVDVYTISEDAVLNGQLS